MSRISRRTFIKMAAAAAGLLAGCRPAPPQPSAVPTPVPTSVPSATPRPTDTPMPTPTPVPTTAPVPTPAVRRPDIIQMYPDVPSKVVHTHHTGVWDGETLVPEAIRQMLDASITTLTGLDDAAKAWGALFDPGERIAIKVNSYGGSFAGSQVFTHVPLVAAVAQALQDVGVPAEQIFVYDFVTSDLEGAGYTINREGPGVRCYGTAPDWEEEGDYTAGWTLLGKEIGLSNILLRCDALINIPVLKTHGIAGLTFALKSHYGTFDRPWDYHGENVLRGIAGVNALPPIKDRTRLIVGDVLEAACFKGAQRWPDWNLVAKGDSILTSFDPVALDALGLQRACQLMAEKGEDTGTERLMTNALLKLSVESGLGTDNSDNMDLIEINLA